MHDFQEQCQTVFHAMLCGPYKTMRNTTIAIFGFCYIRNNQGQGKCYQPVISGTEGRG